MPSKPFIGTTVEFSEGFRIRIRIQVYELHLPVFGTDSDQNGMLEEIPRSGI
jgi:hypothetical protein